MASKLRKDTPKFIEDAIAVHGDRYDYSCSVYVGSKSPIGIICKIHGIFKQRPNDHLQGKGCPICGAKSSIDTRRYSAEDFIRKCEKVHPNKFTYEKCNFIDSSTKVMISCKEHGDFLKSPKSLLRGSGCPECGFKARSKSKTMTEEDYIKKCKKRHATNNFDYSNVNYKCITDVVEIVCKDHGKFTIKAGDFLYWGTCPSCSHGFKTNRKGYVYIIAYFTSEGDAIFKYGISNYTPNRIKFSLKKNFNIVDAVILHNFEFEKGEDARNLEKVIKQELNLKSSVDKNFMPDGWTETFHQSDYRKLINYILRKLNGK